MSKTFSHPRRSHPRRLSAALASRRDRDRDFHPHHWQTELLVEDDGDLFGPGATDPLPDRPEQTIELGRPGLNQG